MKAIAPTSLLFSLAFSTAIGESAWNANGNTGYIELPSANLPDIGETSFSYFATETYSGQRLQFQPSEALALGVVFSDDDTLGAETGLDLGIRLLDEKKYIPSIAIGFQDLFGIGTRSAEYVVATKSFGAIEGSLGIGWGALSGSEALIEGDKMRPAIDKHKFSTDHFFTGDASLFAGLSYQTPIDGLSLSAEYLPQPNGDDYRYGIFYRPSSRLGFGLYARSEDEFGFSITLAGNPYEPVTPQDIGAPPITVVPRRLMGMDLSPAWAATPGIGRAMGTGLKELVATEGATLRASKVTATKISLEIEAGDTLLTPKPIGRIMRSLAMSAPGSVEIFEISVVNENGIPVSALSLSRDEFEEIQDHVDRNALAFDFAQIKGAKALRGDDVYRVEEKLKRFDLGWGVSFDLDMFGDDNVQFRPYLSGIFRIMRGLSLNAYASGNLSKANTDLPATHAPIRVRSDKSLYRQDAITLERLSADYQFKIGSALYGRAALGLLETQYGGVSGELIYAPPSWPVALGIDAASVTKRDPENSFGFLDYETTTGFATLYWDSGFYGVDASISYGRFLNEDWGGEIKLARKFRNGWRVEGALAMSERFEETRDTRDLVPSVSVSIPLQWSMPKATRAMANIGIGGSTSDYAAKLKINEPVYPSIRDYDERDYELRWGSFWQ